MIKNIYTCAQQVLYAVAIMVWQNYQDNLAAFTAHKAKYTKKYGDEALAAAIAAKDMPDDQARSAVPENNRVQLTQLANSCLSLWQKLKTYITDAFILEEQKAMLEAAGFKQYKAAANQSWDSVQGLVASAALFITDYNTQLSKGGENMPADFVTEFTTAKDAFDAKYAEYLLSAQAKEGGTGQKIIANNDVYDTLIKMCADGQVIFADDPLKKSLFVFDTLASFVTTPGASGLRIVTKEVLTETPIQGVAFTVQPGNIQGVTDENGLLVLTLPQDTYSIVGIKDGYDSFTEEVNITTGVVSRKNIELAKTA